MFSSVGANVNIHSSTITQLHAAGNCFLWLCMELIFVYTHFPHSSRLFCLYPLSRYIFYFIHLVSHSLFPCLSSHTPTVPRKPLKRISSFRDDSWPGWARRRAGRPGGWGKQDQPPAAEGRLLRHRAEASARTCHARADTRYQGEGDRYPGLSPLLAVYGKKNKLSSSQTCQAWCLVVVEK